MNDEDFELIPDADDTYTADSDKSRVIWVGPSDTTPRPPRPLLLKLGLEMQAKIAKWKAWKEEQARAARKTAEGASNNLENPLAPS